MTTTPTPDSLKALFGLLNLPALVDELDQTSAKYPLFVARSKDDWKEYYGINGVDIFNHLHPQQARNPLILESSVLIPVPVPSFWLVEGSVVNALSVKCVRCHIYRYADKYLGYYHDNHPAIYYDDNTLMIHVIFKTEEKALLFESHVLNEMLTFGSPMNNLQIVATTSPLISPANCGSRIYFKDYRPTESESPQDSISQITPVFSTFESTTDEFKFQRIENMKVFGSGGKAESCHLMSGDHCRKYESLKKFDNDKNNRLALSRDMHGWFDAMSTSVPRFNVRFISVSETPILEFRYEVKLSIEALDAESANMVFGRLKEGSTKTDNELIMNTVVHVVKPDVFKKCLLWKTKHIDKKWEEFSRMDSAIP